MACKEGESQVTWVQSNSGGAPTPSCQHRSTDVKRKPAYTWDGKNMLQQSSSSESSNSKISLKHQKKQRLPLITKLQQQICNNTVLYASAHTHIPPDTQIHIYMKTRVNKPGICAQPLRIKFLNCFEIHLIHFITQNIFHI